MTRTPKDIAAILTEFVDGGGQLFATDDWRTAVGFTQLISVNENHSLALCLPSPYRLVRVAEDKGDPDIPEDAGDASQDTDKGDTT